MKKGEAEFKNIVLFPITERGSGIAAKLRARFADALVYTPSELAGSLKEKVRENFRKGNGLVFISAAGICVRAVSPFLRGKHLDPAVVCVDERGKFAISLLSGHLGRANSLARSLAEVLNATPVITTATDLSGLPSIEDVAEKFDLAIEDVKKIKRINSAILEGRRVCVIDGNPGRLSHLRSSCPRGVFSFRKKFPSRPGDAEFVLITSLLDEVPPPYKDRTLLLRPREFVAGIGTGRGVGAGEVAEAVRKIFRESGISPLSIKKIATIDLKAGEKGLLRFARRMDVPVEYFSGPELKKIAPPSGGSRLVVKRTGARGVCEPAALLSSGGKRLWTRKRKAGRVTVAIARVPFT